MSKNWNSTHLSSPLCTIMLTGWMIVQQLQRGKDSTARLKGCRCYFGSYALALSQLEAKSSGHLDDSCIKQHWDLYYWRAIGQRECNNLKLKKKSLQVCSFPSPSPFPAPSDIIGKSKKQYFQREKTHCLNIIVIEVIFQVVQKDHEWFTV